MCRVLIILLLFFLVPVPGDSQVAVAQEGARPVSWVNLPRAGVAIILGDYAYVGDDQPDVEGKYWIHVVGLENEPARINSIETTGRAFQMWTWEQYLIVQADPGNQMLVYDISDPSSPIRIATVTEVGWPIGGIAQIGHYFYFYISRPYLRVIDVSTPIGL